MDFKACLASFKKLRISSSKRPKRRLNKKEGKSQFKGYFQGSTETVLSRNRRVLKTNLIAFHGMMGYF